MNSKLRFTITITELNGRRMINRFQLKGYWKTFDCRVLSACCDFQERWTFCSARGAASSPCRAIKGPPFFFSIWICIQFPGNSCDVWINLFSFGMYSGSTAWKRARDSGGHRKVRLFKMRCDKHKKPYLLRLFIRNFLPFSNVSRS